MGRWGELPIAARKNTVSEGETPIDSAKYNQEINNIYTVLNQILKFYASATSPADPQANQTWLDTTTTPALLRRFDGTVWRWTGMYVGTTIPSNPIAGAIFIHGTTGAISTYTGTEWIPLGAEGVAFDPTGTILTATDVEAAIKELIVDYQAAEAARDEAVGAASNAGTYMGQAQTAKAAAEAAQSGAQTARTGAEAARTAAEAAQSAAEAANATAQQAATSASGSAASASTARTGAETAQTAAQSAQSAAETAKTAAETARTGAETAQTGAVAAKTAAETAQGAAVSAKTAAETAQGVAETARDEAVAAKGAAETARDAAQAAAASAEADEIFMVFNGKTYMKIADELDMQSKKILNVDAPVDAGDAVNKDYVDSNAYTHPTNHAPSIISQDANNRFVTDAEKSTWNAKASTAVATTSANGLMSSTDKTKLNGVPSPAAAQAGFFLGVNDSGAYVLVEVSTTWGAM